MEQTSGWSIYDSNITYDTTVSNNGSKSLKINNPNSTEKVVHTENWMLINNATPTQYTYSAWVKSNGTNPQAEIFLFMKTDTETGYFSLVDSKTIATSTNWVLIQKTFTVPANIKKISIRLDNNAAGVLWFDDVKIVKTADVLNTTRALSATYNAFKSPVTLSETNKGSYDFLYNASNSRSVMYCGGLQTNVLQRQYRKYYSADGSMEVKQDIVNNTNEFVIYIGGDGYTAPIILKSDGVTQNYFYLHRDYLGSIVAITNQNATAVEKRHFDAWGNIAKIQDEQGNILTSFRILDRGYTGHEHLQDINIIHMNGRLYDPVVHRFMQPDNFVQDPFNTQNFNRYSYVMNNPLKYTDVSGEFAWIPVIIGAVIGAYSGGVIANGGQLNPTKWEWNMKTLGYMIGGAIVGGVSGGVSNGVATSGVAFANTKAILVGSMLNGMGTHIYTGGKTNIVLSFGFASLNFTTGEFGYLFKKGNSLMETIGYSIGLFANLSDSWSYIKTSYLSDNSIQLQTDGHSQIYNPADDKTFSWGAMTPEGDYYPRELKYLFKKLNSVTNYKNSTGETWLYRTVNIRNVNLESYYNYINSIGNKGFSYRMGVFMPLKSMHCTIAASKALFSAGVFNLPIFRAPALLDFQMRIREYMYLSYSLQNN